MRKPMNQKPKSYLKLIKKYIFSDGEQFPLTRWQMPWIMDMPPEVVEQLLDFYSSDLVHDTDCRVQNLTKFFTSSYLQA